MPTVAGTAVMLRRLNFNNATINRKQGSLGIHLTSDHHCQRSATLQIAGAQSLVALKVAINMPIPFSVHDWFSHFSVPDSIFPQ